MNIVVLDGYTLNPGDLSWKALEELGKLMVYDRTKSFDILKRAGNADVILTNKVILSESIIKQLPKLKYIGVLATGYNVVDIIAAKDAGVIVTNIPSYSTDSVAQIVFAFILNFAQQVFLHSREVKNGKWSKSKDFSFSLTPQIELKGKILGIIGFGRIGQAIAKIGNAFGMEVIYQNRSRKSIKGINARQVEMDVVFKESDFLSINCPLSESNVGFVNSGKLELMKKTAYLINTGRGPLINEQDLADFLNEGLIAGAAMDVLSEEPPKDNNPLLSAENCVITPHIGWATKEARKRLMDIAVGNVSAFIAGKPVNVVS